MDELEKAKRITMRDFLLEVMIVGYKNLFGDGYSITKELLLHKANTHGYIAYGPLRVTKSGLAFIDKWKDLK